MTLSFPPPAPETRATGREPDAPHALAVACELDWLARAIETRLAAHFAPDDADLDPVPAAPALDPASALGTLIGEAHLDTNARLILALALAPHVAPALLDPFFLRNSALDRPFTEFGGQIPAQTGGFLPTGETAIFLLAGSSPEARIGVIERLCPTGELRRRRILDIDIVPIGAPPLSGALSLAPETVDRLLTGRTPRPDRSPGFPAHQLTTRLGWDELVLPPDVIDQIEHIAAWVNHEERILGDWGLGRALKPGYRALFYGPPGTGKTLTAALLGQRAGVDVYRVDLSMVVSKYIGETEKNLARIFDKAAEQSWILFFDEADALFGARTATTSSHDRHANQEVAYLLQRIEDCPCLVILATNLRGNIDDAFSRRFQSVVGFTRPDQAARRRLWQGILSGAVPLEPDIALADLARDHELTGGAILNVVRHAAVTALRRGAERISRADLAAGIAGEARKEGRMP